MPKNKDLDLDDLDSIEANAIDLTEEKVSVSSNREVKKALKSKVEKSIVSSPHTYVDLSFIPGINNSEPVSFPMRTLSNQKEKLTLTILLKKKAGQKNQITNG